MRERCRPPTLDADSVRGIRHRPLAIRTLVGTRVREPIECARRELASALPSVRIIRCRVAIRPLWVRWSTHGGRMIMAWSVAAIADAATRFRSVTGTRDGMTQLVRALNERENTIGVVAPRKEAP